MCSSLGKANNNTKMNAKIKCSNCGAEITNLTMTAGKRQWLWFAPLILVGFLPLFRMSFFKPDYAKDLSLVEIVQTNADRDIQITGKIQNSGTKTWGGITIDAEFYDSDGKFIDEETEYLRSDVRPKEGEYFKISFPPLDGEDQGGRNKVGGEDIVSTSRCVLIVVNKRTRMSKKWAQQSARAKPVA